MDPIIKAEHLSKRYRIGARSGFTSLRDAVAAGIRAPLRRLRQSGERGTEIWALKDVSFEIAPGEVVGIIGRNGAGKSTLLKILSRVTEPTTGRIELYGRIGSLLEVGIGFHPELTGRENVYLNGAILGMPRAEIRRKFDEIVQFAEIERFLDTPVKRYSSGMYVRLAFAVAAHLEPDILLVDEVLAVGDAAFQRKCLGKMEQVAGEGRTVLFVSHNMTTIQSLCTRAYLLEGGQIAETGPSRKVVRSYLQVMTSTVATELDEREDRRGDGSVRATSMRVESLDGDASSIHVGSRLKVTVGYRSDRPIRHPRLVVSIYDITRTGIYLLDTDVRLAMPEFLPPEGELVCYTDPIYVTP